MSQPKITYPKGMYRVQGYATEEDGGILIRAAKLPGCITEGETMAIALDNFQEAATGCIEAYLANGGTIPWENVEPPFCYRRVTVFVQTKEPANG
jgi:predicted RNase H-like HicB family nuclease